MLGSPDEGDDAHIVLGGSEVHCDGRCTVLDGTAFDGSELGWIGHAWPTNGEMSGKGCTTNDGLEVDTCCA